MKLAEPWGCQRLSFLLEKAASREAKMWKVYVPKKPSSQVSIYFWVHPLFTDKLHLKSVKEIAEIQVCCETPEISNRTNQWVS